MAACSGRPTGQAASIFALNDRGAVLKRLPVPFPPAAVLRTSQGLLVSNWERDELCLLDPGTGRVLTTERAPDDRLTGLTAVGRYVWCSRGSEIICFDRDRHLPVCGFNAAPAAPGACDVAGLVAEGNTLWFANSATNQIVQIQMPGHGQWVAGGGRVRQAGFEMVYRNSSGQAVEAFTVLQHVPFLEMPGQRYLALQIQPTPRAFFRDDLGNVIALLDFGALPPGQAARCRIATTMWVADRRMVINPDLLRASGFTPAQRAYATRFHPIAGEDTAEVKAFVAQAEGGETNPYWKVRKAHDALCAAIYYREPADESVPGVLREGYGVCRNYSAAMESFGRLLGVPVLNAWAPRHETSFLMLPGVGPARHGSDGRRQRSGPGHRLAAQPMVPGHLGGRGHDRCPGFRHAQSAAAGQHSLWLPLALLAAVGRPRHPARGLVDHHQSHHRSDEAALRHQCDGMSHLLAPTAAAP